jgi:Amt family ammonium transporter
MSWCSDADKAALVASGINEAATAVLCSNHGGGPERRMALDALEVGASVDASFMLSSAYLVFFMQAGFAMLCAGSVRSKNVMNILIKNILDACVGAVAFYLFGFGVAYGKDKNGNSNPFIDSGSFALAKGDHDAGFTNWNFFLFQWAFSAAAATIVSGSVAERTAFQTYLGYSFFLTAFVYPTVVHWVWDDDGWLSAFKKDKSGEGRNHKLLNVGMIDFAGSGVVHMVGGFAGLMGAMIVGPRTGRFGADGRPIAMPGHNASLVVLGTFILWVGWYGFNPGSMLAIVGADSIAVVGRSAVCTTMAAAAGGLTAVMINYCLYGVWDLIAVCNGVLAGLVSITAGCSVVEPYAAILAGMGGAVVIWSSGKLLLKLRIDDPLEAFPMHGMCGVWGCLFVGFFATEGYVKQAYGLAEYGVLYGGSGNLLACQIIGVVVIIVWTCTLLGLFFGAFRAMGMLRISAEEEAAGLDESKHGGSAYNMEVTGSKKEAANLDAIPSGQVRARH